MKFSFALVVAIFVCLFVSNVLGQWRFPRPTPKSSDVFKPRFNLEAAGGGKNLRNFQAGFDAGVNTKVWENKKRNKNLEVGVKYGQDFLRHQGQTFKSKPNVGAGLTFRFKK